ncbi:ArsR/SmtB family transcription factor [Sporolactobacillus kofuensis]|uniref:ArsR/SmtB family transcription factor n=1 Tax=Sporolactobacillus kofuensis TaxID=269672 RepID=A0ABW1WH40_9BACL|nr:metalloregulator ArsR/SmtB family transcription factor [Sporolactobacillus kofuensis]MCO7175051.1 metalloregulator ArsR/SmtB family transcription factor [Sporolactobacillus kofuensis]
MMPRVTKNDLFFDTDLLFFLEKCYLTAQNQPQSPTDMMREISDNYNIPLNIFSKQIDVVQSEYDYIRENIYDKFKPLDSLSLFQQFFTVESPADTSLALHLYLFNKNGQTFESDEQIEGEELTKRKFMISQILNDDYENLATLNGVSDLTDYLWQYPSTNYKKWICILTLYHAKKLTDQLLNFVEKSVQNFSNLKRPLKQFALFDLDLEKNNKLISDIIGDTTGKQIIKMPTIACFNAIKIIEDGYSNRTYIFIGVLYNEIGELIEKYSQSDKIVVSRLKAIGDSKRLGILKTLRKQPLCGKDIASLFDLTPATVSHHMNSLVNGGLVSIQRTGTRVDYKINKTESEKLIKALKNILL